ncbi:hypothetical protein [Jeongeupia chitinilytica]|uniref:Uncharacterized protein n=1 Tax=Jeongeupia chitinilytica TaxID=1041641 RepID=A0ABQ3H2Z9_9NEIS|nr:hypothetical protein [Jeongeupia chitinilytica]GHD67803.1 hypothetical protein GCM10007350_32020 [Jeongeupia chitinilytica]
MWGKLIAATVLGLPLSTFSVGAVLYAWPGPWQDGMVPGMLAILPVWLAVVAASPLFRSAPRAWGSLALATLAAFAALSAARTLGG